MNVLMRVLVGFASIGVPTALALAHVPKFLSSSGQPTFVGVTTIEKDASRLISDGSDDKAELLVELSEASRPVGRGASLLRPMAAFEPPPRGPGVTDPGAGPFFGPAAMPSPPRPPLTQASCEDGISRDAALAGFLRSKLRLLPEQREAWRKLEDAAEPAIQKLHAACERLPSDPTARPSLPDMTDLVEAQLSARLELLRTTRAPLRTLYEMLTPEQRARLQPPAAPPRRL